MDLKTRTKSLRKTPYDKYRTQPIWPLIEKAIEDLQDNEDIAITTHPDYVIGYIVKQIIDSKL